MAPTVNVGSSSLALMAATTSLIDLLRHPMVYLSVLTALQVQMVKSFGHSWPIAEVRATQPSSSAKESVFMLELLEI